MFFITPAYAQSAGGGLQDALGGIAPLLLMLPIFYFLLIRPQQQKAKQHQEMVTKIRRGDGVVLAGGIIGKVNRVRDDDPLIDVEIAKGTVIQVVRASVSEVRTKGEPVSAPTRPKSSNLPSRDAKTGAEGDGPIQDADFVDVSDAEKSPAIKKQGQGIIERLLGKK